MNKHVIVVKRSVIKKCLSDVFLIILSSDEAKMKIGMELEQYGVTYMIRFPEIFGNFLNRPAGK